MVEEGPVRKIRLTDLEELVPDAWGGGPARHPKPRLRRPTSTRGLPDPKSSTLPGSGVPSRGDLNLVARAQLPRTDAKKHVECPPGRFTSAGSSNLRPIAKLIAELVDPF